MKKIICKRYFEFDYLYLNYGKKLCFIDPYSLEDDEILIRDIIEIDIINNQIKCYDERTDFKDYETFELTQEGLELFKECKENKFLNNNVYYIKLLHENDDIQEFLRYIRNDKVISYIKDIYGNNKLTIKAIKKISKRVLPQYFTKYSVDNAIKYTDENYNNDLNNKLNKQFQIITLIISILGTGLFAGIFGIVGTIIGKYLL